MIQIPKEELLESLKYGYTEYKNGVANGDSEVDLAHVKGFCTTLEQILSAYGNVSLEEMLEIKRPIIGEVSLRRKKKPIESSAEVDYEIPTIFRKKIK
ncbi:MAG: hypothetical protein U9N33_05680 [Campylobacterota bacterium]|nr:hypothetical protein [Campylobacterota bacterium]